MRWSLCRLIAGSIVIALAMVGARALANPKGGQVVGGSATIEGQGTAGVTVNQKSQSAIINWQSFNIGVGETTRFNQPNSAAVALNRVTGVKSPSSIFGTLTANGRIFLVNPEGFIFGPSARINTAGFLATTHDISNEDFLAGRYNFNLPGSAKASIVNQGTITVTDTGIAALVAPAVRNDGIITARLGKIALASANGFTLDLYGDNLINFALTDAIASQVIDVATGRPVKSLVENRGKLSADGGVVAMSAVTARALVDSVINNSGVVEARSVGLQNGRIVLGAQTGRTKTAGTPRQAVVVSGSLDASGKNVGESGGKVQITGETIALAGTIIDVSGHSGGGTVLIGGDVSGGTPNPALASISKAALESESVPTAAMVSVDAETAINASAMNGGDGGKVVIWSDSATAFVGTVTARGGSSGGDGGFVEVSGHQSLSYDGAVDLKAPNGLPGTLLLDPPNVVIAANPGPSVITTSAIQNALANGGVIVTTGINGPEAGDITIASSFGWNNTNPLTLDAFRNVFVNNGVTISDSGGAVLTLRADNTGTGTGTVIFNGTGRVQLGFNSSFQTIGSVVIYYNPPSGYTNPVDYDPAIGPFSGSPVTAYMLVNSLEDLQNIDTNLAGKYALSKDIDASASGSLNNGAGFIPIGQNKGFFTGALNGQNHTISRLTISSSADAVGLFGRLGGVGLSFGLPGGKITNLGLTNTTIVGTGNSSAVGGFAGVNQQGEISNSFVTGSVTGGSSSSVGGLTGRVSGNCQGNLVVVTCSAPFASIIDSYSTATVRGGPSSAVGGLVGTITNGGYILARSYAAGPVVGGANSTTGGAVGVNNGSTSSFNLTNTYWDMQVTGQSTSAGGFGLTTLQLKSGLPAGFGPTVWGSSAAINDGYPHLLWQTNPAPQAMILTVGSTPTPIILTYVAIAATSVYGSPLPSLQGTVIGFVNGDTLATATTGTLTFTTTATSSSTVGGYPIIGSGLTAIGNYVLAQAPANATALTITPAMLTITANDASRLVGQGNPPFTAQYSGFVLGQGPGVVSGLMMSTPATPASAAGNYPIVPSSAVAPNYTIGYVNGVLTVTSPTIPPTTPSGPTASVPFGTLLHPTGQIADFTTPINLVGPQSTPSIAPASILFSGATQSYLSQRNAIALEYALSNEVFQEELSDLLAKLLTYAYGPDQPLAAKILEFQLLFRDAWQANADFNRGDYFNALNDSTRLVLEVFVKLFGNALPYGDILVSYPLDIAKIGTAFGTAYTYGFLWGQ